MPDKVSEILLNLNAVILRTKPPFRWASGILSPIYTDNRLLMSYPKEREFIVNSFIKLIKANKIKVDGFAGTATAGIPWAAWLAQKMKKPMIFVRSESKDHCKENKTEGVIESGKTYVVVEDLITTGQSSLAACDALKDLSVKVVACISIFNYGFSKSADAFTNAKIPLYSLTEFITLVNMAVEIKYISQEEKKILLEWQRTGKWDDSKQK